ncbi:hypothetical protein JZ751_013178 [Albula glossodonta]|uniref:Uncharacterized protein n=1 Tax=Albula glossodonta TaxID=121402 RepID=A0A8T2P565_9TELE|nr:hypothetical protein JZ751_013178 [Albula glossodonta]
MALPPPLLFLLLLLGVARALPAGWLPGDYPRTEAGARLFAHAYNSTAEEVFFSSTSASWTYNTNLTDHNSKQQVNGQECCYSAIAEEL